ncbi:MAG: histidine kinase [Saprospiraceae bacterium]
MQFEKSIVIGVDQGLPTNIVYSLSKDPDGFMWIGTAEGLCRFDGTHFRIYQNDPEDSTSLYDNRVYDVQSYRGRIWAATAMGLSVLDPKTGRFIHYQIGDDSVSRQISQGPNQQVYQLFVGPKGDLWIGTHSQGVVRYRAQSNDFQYYKLPNERPDYRYPVSENEHRVLSIAASAVNDSFIYAGRPSGLQVINRYSGESTWLHFPQATPEQDLYVNAFRRLYCHENGLVYVGGWRAGIHVYDPVAHTLVPLPLKPGSPDYISTTGVRSFDRKNAEEIWISTSRGIVAYNTKTFEVTYRKDSEIENKKYYGIEYIDEEQRVWLPEIDGIHIFDPRLQQFAAYSYEHLHPPGWSFSYYMLPGPSKRGLLLLPRHDGGIYHFDLQDKKWQRFLLKAANAPDPQKWLPRGFARAPDGSYTISDEQGLFSYWPERHKFIPLPVSMPFSFTRYGPILWDHKGRLWVCVGIDGLVCWDPVSNTVRTFQQELMPPDMHESRLVVLDIFQDSRQQIWIRRNEGYSVYLPARDTFLNFLYPFDPEKSLPDARGFAEDREGRVWINSADSWIGYADSKQPELGLIRKINLKNTQGLGEVYQLTADGKGDIWGYTNKEMVHINAADGNISTYSFDYGILNPDFYSLCYLPGNVFVIGGRNQIVLFDPSTLNRNTEQPKPYIEQVKVLGKSLPAIPLVDQTPELHLNYWENFFSIDFSATAYTLGNKCRFRYRLRGFEDWQEAGNRRFANYTNVPGGDYTFQIQVANNEGVWSKQIVEFPVEVDTAWWATWWFRIAVALAILLLTYAVYRYRIIQIRKQERLRSEFEKKLANVEMSALLAQMNPHFLFNSLNSIDSYIIRNDTKKASEYLNNFARLMRLILMNSRTNYINLKDELESLDLYLQMESMRFRDKFDYEIRVNGDLDVSAVNIPPMLIQPYVENAIWHGLMHKDDGKGKVLIQIEQQNGTLTCTIEDNGVGRVRAMELGQKRSSSSSKSKSMGMQITEDRIEIINKLYDSNTQVKLIDLYDDAGTACGTRIVLTVPV